MLGKMGATKTEFVNVFQPKGIWGRPLKPNKLTILAGLEDYVVGGEKEEFLEALNKNIKKEDHGIELKEANGNDKGATR